MPTRPCLGPSPGQQCPARRLVKVQPYSHKGSRCADCQRVHDRLKDAKRGGHGDWRKRAAAVAEHREQVGEVCPGWGVPPHSVIPPNKLSADHAVAVARGGSLQPAHYGVLCVECNSRKRDR
jgi:hypothetical protein